MANAPAPKASAPKGAAPKGPKKEKNLPPEEDDDLEFGKKSEDNEGKAPKGIGTLKLVIMIVIGMAVGIGGAVAGMKIFGGAPPAPAAESQAANLEAEEGAPPAAPQRASGGHAAAAEPGGHGGGGQGENAAWADWTGPVNVEIKPFIVNLNDLGGRRMLKLTMSIEAETPELAEELNAKMPQVRDTILLLLSSVQSDDISGLDGKQRLKNQMLNRINPVLTRGKVRNLYLSEMVVQ